jgi:glycosyltransferase involved in cell wall biosynthesis
MATRPTLTIALCTRNRPEMAAACAARLLACDPPADEILVVDQSDGDATRRGIEALPNRSRLRLVATPTRGLSRSRNIAIREATGELIAFTDDDCLPRHDWPERLRDAFVRWPEAAAVTGASRPEDVAGLDARAIAATTWAPPGPVLHRGLLDPANVGGGLNMAIRAEALAAIGGFDERLGAGVPLLGADDQDILHRLLRERRLVVYDPAAVVSHRPWRDASEQRETDFSYSLSRGGWTALALRSGDLSVLRLVARSSGRSALRSLANLLTGHPGAALYHASIVGQAARGFTLGLAAPRERAPLFEALQRRAERGDAT